MSARFSNLTITVLLAAVLASGCDSSEPPSRAQFERAAQVIVQPLRFEPQVTRVEAVGTSRAIKSIELHPESSGEVTAIHFQPGQRVAAGDLLVELDSRDVALAVKLAEVRLSDARRLLERYQKSASSGAVLPTTLDAAATEVELARIALEQAKIALDHRTIVAAFDGHVGITEVDAGDRVDPATLITTLDDRSALLVRFSVPEALIGDLAVGSAVEISTWNDPKAGLAGEIVDVGSRIDPATRSFVARARVDNPGDQLRPGQSFRVSVEVEGRAYPVIAETALQWGAEGAYIWTVVDGKATRVPVDVVQRNQGRVLVEADVQLGDLIVVEGIQRMREGIAVDHGATSVASTPLPLGSQG